MGPIKSGRTYEIRLAPSRYGLIGVEKVRMPRLVTISAGCALALAIAAPAAAGWSSPRRLAPSAQAPVYASDAHGRFYALFAHTSGSTFRIKFDRLGRKAGRAEGGERVDTSAAPAGGDYTLALAPSGRGV